jgi:ribosomal protein S18 acetylase RimI-like enzyme
MMINLLLLGILITLPNSTLSLAASVVSVSSVHSSDDVRALADLRFDEWIAEAYGEEGPSRGAFRIATAEIYQERKDGGATAFLARLHDKAVGAAELSPIELHGCETANERQGRNIYLYATDVVTARTHRRMGVGASLMDSIEKKAVDLGASQLLLHVEKENTAALNFYRSPAMGYGDLSKEVSDGLDLDLLAENAGVKGQLLLGKSLPPGRANQRSGGGGFGVLSGGTKKKPKR